MLRPSAARGYDRRVTRRFHVIEGTPAEDTPKERVYKRLRAQKVPGMLQCPRCAGREIVETRLGAMWRPGGIKGGVKQYLCATCLLKGERIVVR